MSSPSLPEHLLRGCYKVTAVMEFKFIKSLMLLLTLMVYNSTTVPPRPAVTVEH